MQPFQSAAATAPRAAALRRSKAMTQTTSRFFDDVSRLVNDAAGMADGVRREVETVMRTQAERILRELDVPSREEFEALREVALKARAENEALAARLAALEAKSNTAG
jgi:BMFP domain-containing protein YqiC